jgi:hypothetical protein
LGIDTRKYQKNWAFTNREWIFIKLLAYSKYDIKKEKDNTYNNSVNSVDKNTMNSRG